MFIKKGKIAIYLWRGNDRSYLKKFEDCGELFRETKFRMEKNSLRGKDNRKTMGTGAIQSQLSLLADKPEESKDSGD